MARTLKLIIFVLGNRQPATVATATNRWCRPRGPHPPAGPPHGGRGDEVLAGAILRIQLLCESLNRDDLGQHLSHRLRPALRKD